MERVKEQINGAMMNKQISQTDKSTLTRSKARPLFLQELCRRSPRRGQAIIETGFVIVVLLMLTIGLIQYGIIYNANLTLTHITRESARWAAIRGREASAEIDTRNFARNKARTSSINPADLPDENITIIYRTDANGPIKASGEPITVEITYDMRKKFFVPVLEWGGLQNNGNRWSEYKTRATASIE